MTRTRQKVVSVALVSLVSLSAYIATLAPGLTWAHDSADGGELASAAYGLGVAHPPGYPTYVLLAHPLTLLPVGEVATRTNLFSALCAAGAVALLTWALLEMGCAWAAAVSAGLALAFSPLLWSQATVTEVHALNALFAALFLSLAAIASAGAQRPPGHSSLLALAMGAAWGLSLGNHPTAFFSLGIVCLALWRLGWTGLWGLAGALLGLSVYLYLPLRAAAGPPINWGNPDTLGRLWWVVSGGPYRGFPFAVPRQYVGVRLLAYGGLLADQFSVLGLVAALFGAFVMWRADRALLGAAAVTVVLSSAFAIGYDTSDSYLYLLPALVCLALWLGRGVEWALVTVDAWWPRSAWVSHAFVLALPLVAMGVRFPAMDLSDERSVYDFGAATLGQAPREAVLLSRQDAHTFALWYLQHALGRRPDVVVVDLDLLGYDWYTVQLSRRLAPEALSLLRAGHGEAVAAKALGCPVCRIEMSDIDLGHLVCSWPDAGVAVEMRRGFAQAQ